MSIRPPHHNERWTDERIELVRKLWTSGLSASQIAKQIGGTTRNAVIGIIHRRHLGGRTKAAANQSSAFVKRTRPARSVYAKAAAAWGEHSPGVKAPTPVAVEVAEQAIPLKDLTRHTCRWPIGDPATDNFGFCGAHTEAVYCATHHARDHVAPTPGRAKALRRMVRYMSEAA